MRSSHAVDRGLHPRLDRSRHSVAHTRLANPASSCRSHRRHVQLVPLGVRAIGASRSPQADSRRAPFHWRELPAWLRPPPRRTLDHLQRRCRPMRIQRSINFLQQISDRGDDAVQSIQVEHDLLSGHDGLLSAQSPPDAALRAPTRRASAAYEVHPKVCVPKPHERDATPRAGRLQDPDICNVGLRRTNTIPPVRPRLTPRQEVAHKQHRPPVVLDMHGRAGAEARVDSRARQPQRRQIRPSQEALRLTQQLRHGRASAHRNPARRGGKR